MAVKRCYIRVNFAAIEPAHLVEILQEIEDVVAEIEGVEVDVTMLPERLPPIAPAAGRPEV